MGAVVTLPEGASWWRSHAQVPTVLPLTDDLWRIYFAGRNATNNPAVLFADVAPRDGMRVLRLHDSPILPFGGAGRFDQHGAMPASVWRRADRILLAYSGLDFSRKDHPESFIGLAESTDGGETFSRLSDAPLFGRGPTEPWGSFNPLVLTDREGHPVEMYYNSIRGADIHAHPTLDPYYDIRRAVADGEARWRPDPNPVVPLRMPDACGLARPWVIKDGEGYEMWFSGRGQFSREQPTSRCYRLFHTVSVGGRCWSLPAEGITWSNPPKEGDWDHEMQCYPCIVRRGNDQIMFYCGNWNGKWGFGVALREV